MKRKIFVIFAITAMCLAFTGCESCDRMSKDWNSDMDGGLNRVLNIYSLDGKLIKTIEGKFDIQVSEGGKVLFDLDGKRYIYYNCMVEAIEQ